MTLPRLLAEWSHDPGCSCSRTSLGCCLRMAGTLWPMSFRDWPRSAMWDVTGYYELPTQAPPTSASASSSSPGLLPTPSSSQFNDGESLESWEARNKRLRESWSSERHPHGNGNGMGTPLPIAIRQVLREPASHPSPPAPGSLLPTPNAFDAKISDTSISPEAAERQMSRTDGFRRTTTGSLAKDVEILLKTPTAQLAVNGGSQHPGKRRAGGHGPTLADQVEHELLPTPQAADARRGTDAGMGGDRPSGAKRSNGLQTAVVLLPTPTAADGDRQSATYPGGNPTLSGSLLPTPSVTDAMGGHSHRSGERRDGLLLPGVAEALASPGGPTGRLLQGGSPSSDVPHQAQLSLGEPGSD